MDWGLVIGVVFVVVMLIVMLPRLRDRYDEEYTDDRAFLQDHRPRMWNLIGSITGPDDAHEADRDFTPGRCPQCGTENAPDYEYCRNCGGRLLPHDE